MQFESATGYEPANFLFQNIGYTDGPFGGGQFAVSAKGNSSTPLKRVEDIALVRAAERGKQAGFKSMRVDTRKAGFECLKKYVRVGGGPGNLVSITPLPKVELSVSYGKELSPGSSWFSIDETFSQRSDRIASTTYTFEQKKSFYNAGQQSCGGGRV